MPHETDDMDLPGDMDLLDDRLTAAAHDLRDHPVEWLTPPPELWDRIEAELKVVPIIRAGTPSRRRAVIARRRQAPSIAWLAAAALIVIGSVAAVVVNQRDNPAAVVVASASLQRVEAPTGEVSAQLIRTSDGYQLKVAMKDMPEVPDGSRVELWLSDPALTTAHDIAALPSVPEGSAVVPLPAGVDPSKLSVINLSLEPIDDNPNYSGTTLLQGVLA